MGSCEKTGLPDFASLRDGVPVLPEDIPDQASFSRIMREMKSAYSVRKGNS